jgi:hypothetical protein
VTTTQTHTITATFPDRPTANAAAHALAAAGIPRHAITLTEHAAPAAETRYLRRLVIIIVLWSILGGAVGALIGLALYAAIGPEGTAGLSFQLVCWALIGHLIVGMIAGYWVLADRTHRELSPGEPRTTLTVLCSETEAQRVHQILSAPSPGIQP